MKVSTSKMLCWRFSVNWYWVKSVFQVHHTWIIDQRQWNHNQFFFSTVSDRTYIWSFLVEHQHQYNDQDQYQKSDPRPPGTHHPSLIQTRQSEWVSEWVTINDQIWLSQIMLLHIYTLCPKTVWKISSQNWELNFHILRLDRIVGRHWIFIPWPAACPASYDLLPTWSEKA